MSKNLFDLILICLFLARGHTTCAKDCVTKCVCISKVVVFCAELVRVRIKSKRQNLNQFGISLTHENWWLFILNSPSTGWLSMDEKNRRRSLMIPNNNLYTKKIHHKICELFLFTFLISFFSLHYTLSSMLTLVEKKSQYLRRDYWSGMKLRDQFQTQICV